MEINAVPIIARRSSFSPRARGRPLPNRLVHGPLPTASYPFFRLNYIYYIGVAAIEPQYNIGRGSLDLLRPAFQVVMMHD